MDAPPNLYQKNLGLLDEVLLRLLDVKAAYSALLNLHQLSVRIFSALVQLNNTEVDKILADAQLTITDEHGQQIFPRGGGSGTQTPTVVYSGNN